MAITVASTGDHYILGHNMVAGVPKAAYAATAAKGHLVRRETAADNEWDLCAATENPAGIVESVNSQTGILTIAEFGDGVTLILPTTGVIALGNKVRATATALGTTVARGVVEADAGGVGVVIDLLPAGADTATVRFGGQAP